MLITLEITSYTLKRAVTSLGIILCLFGLTLTFLSQEAVQIGSPTRVDLSDITWNTDILSLSEKQYLYISSPVITSCRLPSSKNNYNFINNLFLTNDTSFEILEEEVFIFTQCGSREDIRVIFAGNGTVQIINSNFYHIKFLEDLEISVLDSTIAYSEIESGNAIFQNTSLQQIATRDNATVKVIRCEFSKIYDETSPIPGSTPKGEFISAVKFSRIIVAPITYTDMHLRIETGGIILCSNRLHYNDTDSIFYIEGIINLLFYVWEKDLLMSLYVNESLYSSSDIGEQYTLWFKLNVSTYETGEHELKLVINSTTQENGIEFPVKIVRNPPRINLISKQNNTILSSEEVIEISINDLSLEDCWYNWNNGENISLASTRIIVSPETEGYHQLIVYAEDSLNLWTVKKYYFFIGIYPRITVIYPKNPMIIARDIPIHIGFFDTTGLHWIWYSWDGQSNITIDNIDYWGLLHWEILLEVIPEQEDIHFLTIYVNDTYGLITSKSIQVQLDVNPPTIQLINHRNNTQIPPGIILEFNINDSFLDQCWFSWDNGTKYFIEEPWIISVPTEKGDHWLIVQASDYAGHLTTTSYWFLVSYGPKSSTPTSYSAPHSPLFNPLTILGILGLGSIFFFLTTVIFIFKRQQTR